MYQNAPPQYNPNIRSQSPAMGMHQPQQQWGAPPGGYYSPPTSYYQNGMPSPSPAPPQQPPADRSNSVSNTGLIRLTLRKPMGIVFEPMTDPHNPSQQRGVRICDLPRTGAAAMSRKLEVGDELLSINDKTMSRLTFDEIMEFIIEADAERVDLLFRRPAKDKSKEEPISPGGLGGVGSNSNSVKWIDESSDVRKERKNDARDDRRDVGRRRMDDPSVGDDTYTIESQSQYTMDTYEEKYYERNHHRSRNRQAVEDDTGGKRRNQKAAPPKKGKRKQDPIESTSFLDMLIDTLCTSVIGRDASGMCGPGGKTKQEESKKSNAKSKKEEEYNEDDEFTIDDGTYATFEENQRADDISGADDDGTMYTEDDGTLTKIEEESYVPSVEPPSRSVEPRSSHSGDRKESRSALAKAKSKSRDEDEVDEREKYIQKAPSKGESRSSHPQRPAYGQDVPEPLPQIPSRQQQIVEEEESAIASAAVPLKELEYDDREDYAADVSVMESLGGPSLLVERARHEYAVSAGAGHAAAHGDNIEDLDPELAKLVEIHGDGFVPDPGYSREETALRDPYKFYEHAVCTLLQENEPEKVRLLSKLMAKYRGRERHLINKLSARYNREGGQGVSSDRGDRLRTASGEHLTKPTLSGMEKIHEGSESVEGSSALNDPTRANLAAIESVKKRMETESSEDNAPRNKQKDDGWPPAMSDPWGAGDVKGANRKDISSEAGHEETSSRSRHTEDEGSYSEGSSYSGDSLDGTSPAIIAQVSELLNYVYGKTSVAGQIDRVSTIMRAYEGREAVLLELLETKALIKANADSSGDSADLPPSLKNSPGLPKASDGNDASNSEVRRSNVTPETPVSVLSDPTMAKSPQSVEYAVPGSSPTSAATNQKSKQVTSPSNATYETSATEKSLKKKKGIFGGFFGSKKNKGKGKFSGNGSVSTSKSGKSSSKKGLSLNHLDDRSI